VDVTEAARIAMARRLGIMLSHPGWFADCSRRGSAGGRADGLRSDERKRNNIQRDRKRHWSLGSSLEPDESLPHGEAGLQGYTV
jgi:hypothetical protein